MSTTLHIVHHRQRRGVAAVLAMLFLVLMTTLTLAIYSMASLNVQSAKNLSEAERARTAAETGLRWQTYRFAVMNRPKTTVGNLTESYVQTVMWPAIRNAVAADWSGLPANTAGGVTGNASSVSCGGVTLQDGSRFALTVQQLSGYSIDPNDPDYRNYLRVTSTGTFGGARRTVSMDFKVDKKINFAVVGKTRIQLGRNTVVEGPVAMAQSGMYPPFLLLSDFTHFDTALANTMKNWHDFIEDEYDAFDGRISVGDEELFNKAQSQGFIDYDQNGFIDEWDFFVQRFDTDGDIAISTAEFTNPSTGKLYEPDLFVTIDSLGGPLFAGDLQRTGLQDGILDARDGYAKLRGQMSMVATASQWNSNNGSNTIHDEVQGPIINPDGNAVAFGVPANRMLDLNPQNFNECAENFRLKSGTNAGPASISATVIRNATLTVDRANGGKRNERTPYGSTTYQATYERPVFRNMTFRNVTIPKGMNALFENCTFEGVTFVDMTKNIGTTSQTAGMTWSKRMKSGSFSANTVLKSTNSHGFADGNNIRFDGCTFTGPIVSPAATAYTHFTNSWEFTGATRFDNQVDQTATIVAPQTNIEMGSFTNPGDAPSTLVGVVVAGNIDIRGTSIVDGSIIVTGDGAGNTTLAYFGPSDSDTDPSALPEGGFGRLNIRYNPYRSLPDGINIPITIEHDAATYQEGM